MIKHVVMWRFKDKAGGKSAGENRDIAAKKLKSLKGRIPGLESMETGLDISNTPASFELVLITTHDDINGLENYRIHPDHQEVVRFIKSVTSDRVVVDFKIK